VSLFRRAATIGIVFGLVGSVGVALSGHAQAQVMTRQQPMKMAAAEALYGTQRGAAFSLFAIGTPDGSRLLVDVTIPHALSVLATNTWDGEVKGIDDVQSQEVAAYGPGSYTPVIPVTYWTFRLMAGAGLALAALMVWGLFLSWRHRLTGSRWFNRVAVPALAVPFLASSAGWIFTEMGRQPWVVYGLLRTASGVSPTVGTLMVVTTLAGFTLLYGALAVVDGYLMVRIAGDGLQEAPPEGEHAPLLAY
jgi:cytochrome d ubiquinol oxidase subunit I